MEGALPAGGIHAVLCVCPSAGHLCTTQNLGMAVTRLLNLDYNGDTLPRVRRCHFIPSLTTEKFKERSWRGWPCRWGQPKRCMGSGALQHWRGKVVDAPNLAAVLIDGPVR